MGLFLSTGAWEPPSEDDEAPGQEAGSKPWDRSEGKAVSHLFYKNKLAHAHLRDPAVMPGESVASKMLRLEILQRISSACTARRYAYQLLSPFFPFLLALSKRPFL